jgi:hypothetical protein
MNTPLKSATLHFRACKTAAITLPISSPLYSSATASPHRPSPPIMEVTPTGPSPHLPLLFSPFLQARAPHPLCSTSTVAQPPHRPPRSGELRNGFTTSPSLSLTPASELMCPGAVGSLAPMSSPPCPSGPVSASPWSTVDRAPLALVHCPWTGSTRFPLKK